MKNFSEISNTIVTSRDKLIEDFSVNSGLSIQTVTKLYEDAKMHGVEDIEKQFKQLLEVNINTFESKIQEFISSIEASSEINSQVHQQVDKNDLILGFLNQCSKDTDEYNFYKVILYVLFLKDQVNFNKLATCIETTTTLNEGFDIEKKVSLFESVGINSEFVKEGRVPIIVGVNDGCEVKDDIRFYSGLKELLSRNNKRWGASYHIDNAYEAIWNYLNQEIEYLTNKDNITTVDQNFEEVILKELLTGELNVMYRDINVLRPLIVDIQTLVFDMMCLVMGYVKQNQQFCRYLNRKQFEDFITAFNALYAQIESSKQTSMLVIDYRDQEIKTVDGKKEHPTYDGPGYVEIYNNVTIDYHKYDVNTLPIKTVAAVDAMYIMKSASVDFNLKIRKYINHFLTKAFDIVGRLEHIIYEAVKIDGKKNPMYF